MPATVSMTFHLRLWLETDEGFVLGPGQAELLYRIREMGSLRQAATSMNMSYRRAWGRLKRTEDKLGRELVRKLGGNKSGYQLTEFGQELLEGFLTLSREIEPIIQATAAKVFPRDIHIHASPAPGSGEKQA